MAKLYFTIARSVITPEQIAIGIRRTLGQAGIAAFADPDASAAGLAVPKEKAQFVVLDVSLEDIA